MGKQKVLTGKLVVVNADGSRHIVPAANESVLKGYNSKLPADKQYKIYTFVDGKPIEDYGKGDKPGLAKDQDMGKLIGGMVAKMDEQEAMIKELQDKLAKSEGVPVKSFTDLKKEAPKKK